MRRHVVVAGKLRGIEAGDKNLVPRPVELCEAAKVDNCLRSGDGRNEIRAHNYRGIAGHNGQRTR